MSESAVRPRYVSLQEAAVHFTVCVRTISNWRRMGFPVLKAGGRILVDLEAADTWVRSTFGGAETAALSTSV